MTHVFAHLRDHPSDFDGVEIEALCRGEAVDGKEVQFLSTEDCLQVTFAVSVHVRKGSARYLTHGGGAELVIEFPDYFSALQYATSLADALGVLRGDLIDQAERPAKNLPHRFYKQARTLLRR